MLTALLLRWSWKNLTTWFFALRPAPIVLSVAKAFTAAQLDCTTSAFATTPRRVLYLQRRQTAGATSIKALWLLLNALPFCPFTTSYTVVVAVAPLSYCWCQADTTAQTIRTKSFFLLGNGMSHPAATTRFTAYATLIHNAIGHPAATTHYFTAYAPLIHSRLQLLAISMSYLVASPLHLHSLALLPHILQTHTTHQVTGWPQCTSCPYFQYFGCQQTLNSTDLASTPFFSRR